MTHIQFSSSLLRSNSNTTAYTTSLPRCLKGASNLTYSKGTPGFPLLWTAPPPLGSVPQGMSKVHKLGTHPNALFSFASPWQVFSLKSLESSHFTLSPSYHGNPSPHYHSPGQLVPTCPLTFYYCNSVSRTGTKVIISKLQPKPLPCLNLPTVPVCSQN